MDDLSMKSGAWRCRWIQFPRSGMEQLQMAFDEGVARGTGTDPEGGFVYSGRYDSLTGHVVMSKVYVYAKSPVPISMTYEGVWDGTMISGAWVDDRAAWAGEPFEMWPVDGEESCTLESEVFDTSHA